MQTHAAGAQIVIEDFVTAAEQLNRGAAIELRLPAAAPDEIAHRLADWSASTEADAARDQWRKLLAPSQFRSRADSAATTGSRGRP